MLEPIDRDQTEQWNTLMMSVLPLFPGLVQWLVSEWAGLFHESMIVKNTIHLKLLVRSLLDLEHNGEDVISLRVICNFKVSRRVVLLRVDLLGAPRSGSAYPAAVHATEDPF